MDFSSSSATASDVDDFHNQQSSFSTYDVNRLSSEGSPMMKSPWNQPTPFSATWSNPRKQTLESQTQHSFIGSLIREEGHIYSLTVNKNILYTGSDSKNIRVWKNMQEFSAFRSNSGLVKAIIISGDKIFTGHQDGKMLNYQDQVALQASKQVIDRVADQKNVVSSSLIKSRVSADMFIPSSFSPDVSVHDDLSGSAFSCLYSNITSLSHHPTRDTHVAGWKQFDVH